ncbi:hypothetical protein [Nakamurella endophytica]|uniref:hypothetical protein n=1 Tax=Nakamurella endophytica TaxID=1748367 RepID=UPI00166CA415|nr:hypothetical protein [Nakamurella endophytica]
MTVPVNARTVTVHAADRRNPASEVGNAGDGATPMWSVSAGQRLAVPVVADVRDVGVVDGGRVAVTVDVRLTTAVLVVRLVSVTLAVLLTTSVEVTVVTAVEVTGTVVSTVDSGSAVAVPPASELQPAIAAPASTTAAATAPPRTRRPVVARRWPARGSGAVGRGRFRCTTSP